MKSLLLGLLIVGTAPVASKAIATSWLTSANSISNSSAKDLCSPSDLGIDCQLSGSSAFNSNIQTNAFALGDSATNNSGLWLQQIANLLLPGWTLEKCWHQSSVIKSQNSVCLSPWSRVLNSSNGDRTDSIFNGFVTPSPNESGLPRVTTSESLLPQFPAISRSSLIVSPPSDKLLPCLDATNADNNCPEHSKLANPAPETERIASPFGWRRRPYSGIRQFHQGIDYGAPLGSPVVAVDSGIVTRVIAGCRDFGNRWCGNQFGNWIEIDHGNGQVGIYGHLLNSSIGVREGMKVWRNQEIAKVGSSGWSTGAHLDFRLKVNDEYQNPADYVIDIDPK